MRHRTHQSVWTRSALFLVAAIVSASVITGTDNYAEAKRAERNYCEQVEDQLHPAYLGDQIDCAVVLSEFRQEQEQEQAQHKQKNAQR